MSERQYPYQLKTEREHGIPLMNHFPEDNELVSYLSELTLEESWHNPSNQDDQLLSMETLKLCAGFAVLAEQRCLAERDEILVAINYSIRWMHVRDRFVNLRELEAIALYSTLRVGGTETSNPCPSFGKSSLANN